MNMRVRREPGGNVILSEVSEDPAAAEKGLIYRAPFSGATALVYGGGAAKLEDGHWLPSSACRCFSTSALRCPTWSCESGCFGCDDEWPMRLEGLPKDRLNFIMRNKGGPWGRVFSTAARARVNDVSGR